MIAPVLKRPIAACITSTIWRHDVSDKACALQLVLRQKMTKMTILTFPVGA